MIGKPLDPQKGELGAWTTSGRFRTSGKLSHARVMITYYTDPLCCWSWAIESAWKKLKSEFRDRIQWKYVMGAMIQDWQSYNDPMNAITRPIQFGPVWMHASQIAGVPIDYSIWHTDPPASSFPSCIAVKCAQLQSAEAGEHLLYHLREAVMTRGLNISNEAVILSLVKELSEKEGGELSLKTFEESWSSGSGADALREDLQATRFLKIGRFPTFTFTNTGAKGIIITGYRPYEVLKDALTQML